MLDETIIYYFTARKMIKYKKYKYIIVKPMHSSVHLESQK